MSNSQVAPGTTTAPAARRTRSGGYAQSWPAYNRAQVREKDEFQVLLRELCRGVEEPPRPLTGRPRLPWRDMVFAAVFKLYCGLPARRFMCDLEAAREKGFLRHLPHYNSVLNFMGDESLAPVLRQLVTESSLPLRAVETFFAVDSTGLGTCRRRRWYDQQKGRHRSRREWVKLHVMAGTRTNIITRAEVSEGSAADSPFFKELVLHTALHFDLSEVSADAAYLAADNQRLVLMAGGVPYIAFRSNSTGDGWRAKSTFWNRMLDLYRERRPEFAEHYYRRNNVETAFFMLKEKFGGRLRGKSFPAQANEALCMALCHNLCCVVQSMHELGVAPSFRAGADAGGEDEAVATSPYEQGARERLAPALEGRYTGREAAGGRPPQAPPGESAEARPTPLPRGTSGGRTGGDRKAVEGEPPPGTGRKSRRRKAGRHAAEQLEMF